MATEKDVKGKAPSAKSIGATEDNTSRAKLLRMGQNPTVVAKGAGVRKS